MAKEKNGKPETWASRMKDFGGGSFTFLSSDGETIIFVVVGLPELLKSAYKGKEQERIGIPVVTEDGFQLLIVGKRPARKLSKYEKYFKSNVFMITRIGAEGDVNAKYPVKMLDDKEMFNRLQEIVREDFEPSMIPDAIKDAEKILQN